MGSQLAKKNPSNAIGKPYNEPWQDDNGNLAQDSDLEVISKAWDIETWNRYLSTMDTSTLESILPSTTYLRLIEMQPDKISEIEPEINQSRRKQKVREKVERLPMRQRKIVKLLFWEDLSEREVAKKLQISRSTVKTQKRRALEAISKIF